MKLFEDQLRYKINPVAKTLEDPKYRPRVIPDKKKYNRKKTKEVAHATFSNNINKERN